MGRRLAGLWPLLFGCIGVIGSWLVGWYMVGRMDWWIGGLIAGLGCGMCALMDCWIGWWIGWWDV